MTRLIDVDALIETMRENAEGNEGWYGDTWAFMRDVESAPTIDAVPRWIPCEERLPEEYNQYLVCTEEGDFLVYWFEDSDWARKLLKREGIIAWMPLPEPYEGESDE